MPPELAIYLLGSGRSMKTMMSGLRTRVRDERGKVLILALIFLVLGALLLTPLLGLMSTGLTAGRVHENRAHSLYAADAGVEDAVNWLLEGKPEEWPWTGDAEGPWERSHGLEVNNHDVNITVAVHGAPEENKYMITSDSLNGESGTRVIAIVRVQPRDQGCIFHEGYRIGRNDKDVRGTVIVMGDVTLENNSELTADDMLIIDGDVHLHQHSTLNAGVICLTGDITLANNTQINADIRFLGDDNKVTINQPSSSINGNIWAEGDLTIIIDQGNAARIEIKGHVYAPSGDVRVYLNKPNSELQGDIYASGSIVVTKGHHNAKHTGIEYPDYDADAPFHILPCPQLPDPTGAVVDGYHVMGYGG